MITAKCMISAGRAGGQDAADRDGRPAAGNPYLDED
jgi:hypothetical protein